MRIVIIAIGTFVLGLTAVAGVNHYTDASASSSLAPATKTPTATPPATATPGPPQPLAVVERNLDGSGNIKVHEQGTVNVSVVPSAGVGRVIPITQNHAGPLATVFVATSDCTRLDLFLAASGGNSEVALYPSIDGAAAFVGTPYVVWQQQGSGTNLTAGWKPTLSSSGASSAPTAFGSTAGASTNSGVASPFVGVEIVGSVAGSVTSSVWLYCRFA